MADRPGRDAYYLEMVAVTAKRSTCPRRAVGAIIVDERGVVLGMGHNGVSRGMTHCSEQTAYRAECKGALDPKGDTSRCWAVHAEVNAILQCADIDRARTLYCSATPCFQCAKVIANTGITRVVVAGTYTEAEPSGLTVLRAKDIEVEVL